MTIKEFEIKRMNWGVNHKLLSNVISTLTPVTTTLFCVDSIRRIYKKDILFDEATCTYSDSADNNKIIDESNKPNKIGF